MMMSFPRLSTLLLAAGVLHADELNGTEPAVANAPTTQTASKWDVEIPAPIVTDASTEPVVKPVPIDFAVEGSRVTRMEVTKAPEMPELPAIKGTINVTVQKVADPNLPDPPPPLPAMSPDDPAVVARLEELREKHRGFTLTFVSATTYDNHRTLLRIFPNGKADEEVTAWSNLDFNHFTGFSTYRVKDAVDGSFHDFGLMMGIGNINTGRTRQVMERAGHVYNEPEIPELPDLAASGPAFVLVEGKAESSAMDTLEQIHDLYRKEGERMEADFHAREKAREERKAYLLANPPKPEDVKIQFWKRNSATGQTPQP